MKSRKQSGPTRKRRFGVWTLVAGSLLLSCSVIAADASTTPSAKAEAKRMAAIKRQQAYRDQWGPAVGSVIEPLAAKDQSGVVRSLPELAGPNGLLLFLVRSADW